MTKRGAMVLATAAMIALAVLISPVQATIMGYLSTDDGFGMFSGDTGTKSGWGPDADGFRLTWIIDQNEDMTWHYKYLFGMANGNALQKLVSHMVISLSANIEQEDLYNFSSDVGECEFGVFGPSPSSPGFPVGKVIAGAKIDLIAAQLTVEFDSTRQPMWGDFYAKDGVTSGDWNFAYNMSIGEETANGSEYLQTPVDAQGETLYKILVPDTVETGDVPEPAVVAFLAFGTFFLRKRKA